MAKNFYEVLDEIKANIKVSDKGKVKTTFSRTDFEKLARAYVNTPDYEAETLKVSKGEKEVVKLQPVKSFRGMIRTILRDFGVDKAEAEKVMESSYEIKTSDMYEFVSELVYKYMEAGKKFEFLAKEDFVGSMSVKAVEETETTYRDIKTKEEKKIKKAAHKILERKSKCPAWLKQNV